ncbi:MAG: GNAT family N-acetyltransferase, partial [Solirubrobacteraceae bacterium]
VEARTRERGFRVLQNIAAANAGAVTHLSAAGYERVGVSQRMRAALDALPAPLDAPVRRFDLDAEGAAIHALIDGAFGEADDSIPLSHSTWRAETAARSEPAFRLALDDEAGLVGAAVGERWEDGVGYVAQLAVVRHARSRGHGRALLLALLHAFRDAGLSVAELSVAGTNAPATGLYESAGMAPDFCAERWELSRSAA